MEQEIKQVFVNGVGVFPFTGIKQVVDYVDAHKGALFAVNAIKIVHDKQLHPLINRNIGYCDGSGPVLALRQKGYKDTTKIAGCDLWLKIIERHLTDYSFYLVGAKREVIEETVEKLKHDYPTIKILGYRDGYLKEGDKELLIKDIEQKKPDVVFVAMGSPEQEILIEEIQKHHSAIYMGLGGSFNVYTNHVERAPKWWVDHHLEFLYRVIKEPGRLKRHRHRYLLTFMWWLLTGKFKREGN